MVLKQILIKYVLFFFKLKIKNFKLKVDQTTTSVTTNGVEKNQVITYLFFKLNILFLIYY